MAENLAISSREIVMRRYSGSRLRAGSLKLRDGETGISCNLLTAEFTPTEMLILADRPNDKVAKALVGNIRNLGLEVFAVPVLDNPGHCEIRSDSSNLEDQGVRNRLADVFNE